MSDKQVFEKILSHFTWGGWVAGSFKSIDSHGTQFCLISGIKHFSTSVDQTHRMVMTTGRCLGYEGESVHLMALRLIRWNDKQPDNRTVLRLLRTIIDAETMRDVVPSDFATLQGV